MIRIFLVGAAALALIGVAIAWLLSSGTNPVAFTATGAETDDSLVKEMTLGDPYAPVTMIEYASFTCPHCKNFHEGPMESIKAEYVDTGKVHFVYREVYFDRLGLWAGMTARCAGEDRYFDIVDMLYEKQSDWSESSSPADAAEKLRLIGRNAGLSGEEYDACLMDDELAEALVAVWEKHRAADNVRSTPSFVIDGEKYSNMSFEEFVEILDAKLKE